MNPEDGQFSSQMCLVIVCSTSIASKVSHQYAEGLNLAVCVQWCILSCLDIRPCWTAGRESHWSGRPSLSWWKDWETCFRPACNRYDGQQSLIELYKMIDIELISVCKKSPDCYRFVSKIAGMDC